MAPVSTTRVTSVARSGNVSTFRPACFARDSRSKDEAEDAFYPQPFGLQMEWTVGRGPQLDLNQGVISTKPLYGGYVQAMYKLDHPTYGTLIPYAKWQPFLALELTVAYSRIKRTNLAEAPYRTVRGNLFRVQLQTHY
ncbi:porin [Paraburkholderia antibiotica]|uniref:porin n=1 Tax=Paraburkholderia antibiotica TaxID=2728839 RepID=UPI002E324324|nr:porin [Paraburkholderia antibiotica]